MKKIFFVICLYLTWTFVATAQPIPKHEVRAAWITAAYGLDWPKTKATNAYTRQRQQAELISILDKLKAANFNTILFQARTRGDVLYRSKIEPFNAILTGKNGQDPGYDPLAFAVSECHKRGMECHAWIVAIPLGGRKHVASLGKTSVSKRRPSICVSYKREYFLNPGHPETKDYLMALTREIVEHYDVDGIHFDYLRYPERSRFFPDRQQFRSYARGRDLAQWRRDNLSDILRHIYHEVKKIKPWVKVSTCPVGKYSDTSRYDSRGWNALNAVYQDVQGWLAEGIQDQIYPMMYFRGNSFYPFALDWKEQSHGRHVIPGMGIYFLDPHEGNWPLEEVERQINFLRTHQLDGQAHYRVRFLMNNTKDIYNCLTERYYRHAALLPSMPWADSIPPAAPAHITAHILTTGYTQLQWTPATDNDQNNAPRYIIYGSPTFPVDTSRAENILAQGLTDTTFVYAPIYPWAACRHFAVTATDRYGNESKPIKISLSQK